MDNIIQTVIEDSLGLNSGISIRNTRVLYDTDGDWIRITGRLSATPRGCPPSLMFEPDLQADVVNEKGQVCISSASKHDGYFMASQKVSFTIDIRHVSDYVPWDEIRTVHMYLIFRERKSKGCSE